MRKIMTGKQLINKNVNPFSLKTNIIFIRNLPHICSFYLKGDCKRGSECPYRHEAKKEGDLANQNLKDRYYGKDDPLANKILNKLFTPKDPLVHPSDKTISTLIIKSLTPLITEQDIR